MELPEKRNSWIKPEIWAKTLNGVTTVYWGLKALEKGKNLEDFKSVEDLIIDLQLNITHTEKS